MQVIVDEVVSSLHAVDGDALLAPRTLQAIVRAVLQAVDEQEGHRKRVRAELDLRGARDEAEAGER